jgi:high-affinity iron transporter
MGIFICSVFCLLFATTSPLWPADEAHRLVALVDYISGDYKNAVQSGKVISQEEYHEMKEFSARSLELLSQLKALEKADKAGIESNLKLLASYIDKRENEKIVAELAKQIREKLIATYKIVPYPRSTPSLQIGKTLYTQNCAQCHGQTGKGDGPGRETMMPKEPGPADFTNPSIMDALSPFRAFNIVTFGVEGTAMPSFSSLSEEERWQAAFYLFSLRFSPEVAAEEKKLLEAKGFPDDLKNVATLSTLSDGELQESLERYFPAKQETLKALAHLRRGLFGEKSVDPLITARTLLQEATALYERGEKEKAYQKAIDAYLEGFELAEPALFAKDFTFGRDLEANFTQLRSSIKRGDDLREVQKLYQEIDAELIRAAELLSSEDSLPGSYVFLNALLIILREGLEAALILAAILASLRVMGATEAVRYIHLGWVFALAAGLLTWILAQTVLTLSGSHRESMEGLTTLLAAIVLFYTGYWLHTKAEATKWRKFIQDKVQEALSGRRILALIGLSFFAVYREAFEVVFFYQALYLQSPNNPWPLIWGFVAGVASLSLIGFVLFKLGLKIPVKYFFWTTGVLLFLLAFVFAGQGVKELQTAGWFSVTPLRFLPQVRLLGVYPTLETLLAQGLMLLALLATLLWSSQIRQRAE